ncbi:hypothetical protein [Micromonospora sediminicola]|uniref:hypothetical protein n=1 Tax=Micromonospora sediminicola TaxID=946078 RepID=UPI000B896E3F|nr:hypothetical protein [Micromonospora sediminicola]
MIAEAVLDGRGYFTATPAALLALFRERNPDSRATEDEAAAVSHVGRARAELWNSFGIAIYPPRVGRREWSFRLVAVPGEEAA